MSYQALNFGTVVNDGTGDTLPVAADKINDNFVEIYNLLGDGSVLSSGISATATVVTLTAPTISGVVGGTITSATITTLTGTTFNAGTLALAAGSITDSSGAISFGNENLTTTGSVTAASLDISGDVDIDGTLETDALTIDGVSLAETISDTVGAMVSSNTETNITVTYDDTTNTLDFAVDLSGVVATTATTLATARTIHGVSFDGSANIDLTEVVQDTVGAMFSSNTETNITATYQDSDGTIDLVIGTLNQNTTGNAATATALETARTIGGTSFDGTANIAVALSATATALANARTIHGVSFDGTANIDLTEVVQDTVGAMFGSNTETGITATYQDSDGTIDLVIGTLNQDTTGSAATLTTARTIGGVSFDGSANINLPGVNTAGNQNTSGTAAVATVATTVTITDNESTNENNAIVFTAGGDVDGGNLGLESDGTLTYNPSTGKITATGFVGALTGAVTGDVTGNADTATALANARTIHGVSFDGSANIDLTEVIEDTVGTMVTSNAETGITVTYQDSDGTFDFALSAAQTTITSLLATDIKIGEDDQTKIDFETADTINFYAGNEKQLILTDGALTPGADNILDLGSSGVEFKDAFFDGTVTSDAFAGPLTGDVTGNADTATALATARTIHGVSFDGSANIDLTEVVQDTVGAMFGSNTETGITVTYQDDDGTIDLVVGTLNQDTTGTAAKVTVTDSTANTNFPVTFHDESNALLDDTGALRYNPSTGTLLVPNLVVAGTTTQVDTVTMNAENAVIFEGATADDHETTLTIIDPTADRTQRLLNQSGFIPLLAAVTTTAITSTPEELNILDGATVVVGEINALDLGSTAVGTAIASKAVILDSNKDYSGIRNLTISGEIDAATGDFSGAVDIAGATTTAAITASGVIKTDNTTEATSTTDGSLQTDGGLSVAKDIVAGDDIKLLSDAAVAAFGADGDVTLTHVADTGLLLNAAMVVQFRDSAINIGSPADGDLDINADDEIELNSTLIDVNGNLDVSGTIVGASTLSATTGTFSGILKTDDATEATSTTDGSLQTDGGLSVVKDAVFGDDIKLLSDSSRIFFGAGNDVLLTHIHNSGLRLTHGGSGDNLPVVLQLKSEEDAIEQNEVIGSLEFAAGDSDGTDGATVAAGIHAIAEDTFSASANKTKLVFTTGVSETAASSATAKATLSSIGDFTVAGDLVIKDGGLIGSASDLDAIAIASDGVVTMNQIPVFSAGINVSGGTIAGTLATAAQGNITSLGTLTTLTVDNVVINGATIGHGDDTDLMTVADGILTVAGEVSMTTLDIGGTNVTSTAAELNILDGVTSTAAELNILDGVTSTAAELNVLDGITAVVGELNALDLGSTAVGTAIASKAVILDSNKDYTGMRNLTISGELDAGSLDISGDVDVDGTLEADAITVNGKTLTEHITDLVGGMVGGNTETGITVTFQDDDNTLDFALGAAQTTITSLLATDIKIGEDDQTKIDFETADEIHFYAANAHQIKLVDGALVPVTDNDIDLGTSSLEFKDAFFDGTVTADAFAGPISGDLTGTLQTAAQANVTSLGTLTTLTVDNIIINGTNIGHTSDTDSIAIASDGVVTFSQAPVFPDGSIAVADLDIDGATDIGAAIVDADLFIIDDGAGGTNRKVTASRIKTYIGASAAADDITAGDAAVTITTSSGDITIDAAANDSDIILKGTDGGADTTFLTIDGSDAGSATFNDKVIVGDGKLVLNSTAVTSTAAELNVLDGITAVVGELNALDIGSTAVGTAVASKAVILDSNKDYTGIRNLTISGEIDAATGDFSGNVDVAGTTTVVALTASGIIKTDDATDATSTTDGSLQTDGGLSVVKDIVAGDDVKLLSDAAVMSFGANSEITLTHVHDVGLTITNTINGTDNRPTVLQLKSEEDAIVQDDVIASIELAAGDSDGTDGATVAAGIHAIAEDTFSASANKTKLVFTTGVSETAASSATAKMTLSSAGLLTIADDFMIKDGGTIGVASVNDAITISSGGIVSFKDDILIKDGGTIGSASDADAIAIASNGVVTFSQAPVFPDGSINIADIDLDGGTDIGAAIVDADLFLIDDGAGGTMRKTAASRLKTYIQASTAATAADDIGAGDAAVNITTDSGNITIDAAANDSDIIFKGTDGGADTTFLTIDGSAAGEATFNAGIVIADAGVIGSASDKDAIAIGSDGDVTLTQDLELQHDGAILSFGADDDVTITHVHDTGLLLNAAMVMQFRDSAINIGSPADGDLDINADDEIELNSTLIDINGAVDISGATTVGGILKTDDATEATSTTDGSLQTDGGLSVVKDIVAGDDIKLLSDAAVVAFGANSEITLTHVHDVGLTVTNTINGTDNRPTVLQLKSEEDAIVADDVIASIEMAAGDSDGTDGATVAAGIHAIAEDTFSASANKTKLVFTTGVSETAASSATAKATLSSIGDFTVAGDLIIKDGGTIGSASDLDAIAIASDGVVTMNQIPVFSAGINVSGGSIAGTLSTAAQGNITSLGTLTTLTVDNVVINGATIGHGDDTDLMTVADGILTVAGEVSMTTLDIGGTNVTSTAAELNILDGVTSTAAELNALDGITAVVGELNALDLGSTAVGNAIASKAVILDSNKDYTGVRNFTLSGELDAGSLDVSGDVDIDGTLEADAITVNGTALAEFISDTAGAMVGSNTETGITVTYQDADNTIDFALAAAQTTITSLLATDIKIGEDDQTKIDFETADEIHFYAANAHQIKLVDGALVPATDNDVDLGTSSAEFKNAFFDGTVTADAFSGPINGDLTGTLQTAAQGNVTSLGTLTTLTVDNVVINGATIGHGDDTDLMTVADGILTVAGEVSMTTLDIGGTNVTSTAAELNILDGVTSTAAELNVLDGITAVVGELNALDLGSTAVGNAIASKAVILDSNKDYTGIRNFTIDGDLDVGDDLKLTSDAALISFGANSEITMTHVHDTGLTLTHTATGDNTPMVLQLKSEEDAIIANEVIASLEFAAGDSDGTDGATVAAGIHAIAEGTFSASANATKLVFTTGVSETAASSATAKMTLSSAGLLTIADDFVIKDGGTIGVASDADSITIASDGVVTFSQEIVAPSLDISGNVDIDGTLEADAITVNGTALAETISDTVGAMVGSNTETGIAVTYQDGDNTIDFAINAAQTTITSLLATDIKIGEDDQTKIDFETADEIHFYAANAHQIKLVDGALVPVTDNDIDLGTSSLEFKNAFFDGTVTSDAFAGPLTGDVTGTSSKVTVTNSTANTNFPVVFNDESDSLLDDTGALRYNPSSGTLLVPNLVVAGTTTQVDTVTMNAANAVVFEGATADDHETTLTIIDPTGDRTINLPNVSGTLPVLAAASTTQITSTPAELNILDGATVVVGEINALDLGSTAVGTAIASKAVILDSNKDYTGVRNFTLSGELDAGSLDVSGDVDVDGTLEADAITVNGTALAEFISDTAGAMVSSNTETGIAVTYQDADNTIDFAINAAQTTITSLLATDIKIGEDDQTKIDFETADEIHFYAANAHQIKLVDGALVPATDNDVDLGTSSAEFKDAFFDGTVTADAFSGPINGDLTGTLQTAAQANVTSLGTLTALTVDNVVINGATIGHGDDTDLMTVADGILTVAGEVSMTTLDIGGTNVTSTAAELNALDGITAVVGELNALDLGSTAVGTAIASKAVILDSNKDYTGIRNLTLAGNIVIADAATIGSASDADAIAIGSDGDVTLTQDLELQHDGAILSFGANDEIKLTHVHDTGLLLTDSGGTPTLQFHDANESISSDGGHLIFTSNGVSFDFPSADGSNGQALITNGSGVFSFGDVASSTAADDISAGDAAVNITTSSGNITIDAAANDSDIIFKGTDGGADITMLTLDGSADGAAIFKSTVTATGIIIGSTAVTSTAAELNILDGVTSTAAELNVLDGITAVVGELNALDLGSTAVGTAIASKAVILDSNKDYTGVRNFTIDGDLDVGDDLFLTSDAAKITFGANSEITATHVHNVGLTLTHTATGANTPMVLELKSEEDAITSANIIGALHFSAGDSDGTDGATVAAAITAEAEGTFSASANATKLVFTTGVTETASRVGGIANAKMTLASDGDLTLAGTLTTTGIILGGTTVTSTAAELNILDGVTSTAAELNVLDGITAVVGELNALDLGSTAVGNAIASKAVILDSNKDYTGIRNFTIDGDLDVGDDLKLTSDAAVAAFGADGDVTLTHVADTGLLLNGTMQLQFNDASQNINAPSGTVLDINATDEIELNATLLDVNANINASGTYTGAGTMTTGGNIVIPNTGNIGSVGDTDAIAIAANGVVTFSQAPVFPDGSIAVADLDIDGATDIGAAIVDADLFIVDDGAGGTNRKTTAARLKTYIDAASAPAQMLIKNASGTTIQVRIGHATSGGTDVEIQNSAGTALLSMKGAFSNGEVAV